MSKKEKALRMVGYGLVSPLDADLEDISLGEQLKLISEWSEGWGYEFLKFYFDDSSLFSNEPIKKRPAVKELISDAKAGKFDMVAVANEYCIGNSLKELLEFQSLITNELNLKFGWADFPTIHLNLVLELEDDLNALTELSHMESFGKNHNLDDLEWLEPPTISSEAITGKFLIRLAEKKS